MDVWSPYSPGWKDSDSLFGVMQMIDLVNSYSRNIRDNICSIGSMSILPGVYITAMITCLSSAQAQVVPDSERLSSNKTRA